MFDLKFDAESFIDFFISLNEALNLNLLSDSAYERIELVCSVMRDKLISSFESECDSN